MTDSNQDGGARLGENDTTSQSRFERSCLACHQRKIRCDKRSPCSNCARMDIVCSYPRQKRAARRPQKATITDVSERLQALEQAVRGLSGAASRTSKDRRGQQEESKNTASPTATENATDVSDEELTRRHRLLQDGKSSLYINEVQLSQILDEQQELRTIINDSQDRGGEFETSISIDLGPLLSGFGGNVGRPEHLSHPSRPQAIQLWQTFVSNVDPVAKVLHIPTMEKMFYASIGQPQDAPAEVQALLFSIYFASMTSLSAYDVSSLLGHDKSVLLHSYKENLERCLAASDFLATPTVMSLQAIVIYIICLRVYNTSRSIWTLCGLAIRAAQSIGLHRDGTNFHLSPFETEMRRRLWWSLCNADMRAAEDHGVSVGSHMNSSNTALPSNVNDRDLSPEMGSLPPAQPGWTEMTYCLVIIRAGVFLDSCTNSNSARLDSGLQSQAIQAVDNFLEEIETEYLQHCDLNIPIQRLTTLIARILARKAHFRIHLQSSKESPARTEDFISRACDILESLVELQQDDLLTRWCWLFESFTQYYLLTLILYNLCRSPHSSIVDRAWQVADAYLVTFDEHKIAGRKGTQRVLLRYLRNKANQERGNHSVSNSVCMTSDESPGQVNLESLAEFNFDQNENWDFNILEYTDWTTFVQTCNVQR